MKKAVAILSIISDIIFTGIFALFIIGGIYFNDEEITSDPFNYMLVAAGALCLIISITATIRIFKKNQGLWWLILGKLDVWPWFMVAFCIIEKEYNTTDGIGAMVVLVLIGTILTIPFIVLRNKKSLSSVVQQLDIMRYPFKGFRPDWEYEDAYKEYIMSIGADESYKVSDEENEKIWEYATIPFAYLFKWLIDRNYVSEGFLTDVQRLGAINDVNSVREGRMSPVRLILAYFHEGIFREHLLPDVAAFFDGYYENYGKPSSAYEVDYREIVQKETSFYYLNMYNEDHYEKLAKRFDEAFEKYVENDILSDISIYSWEVKTVIDYVRWDLFDEELEVYSLFNLDFDVNFLIKESLVNHPHPDLVTRIISKYDFDDQGKVGAIADSLNHFSEMQINNIKGELSNWDFDGEGTEELFKKLSPACIHILPSRQGDLCYWIECTPEFEEEHGIGIIIRNGIVIDLEYAGDVLTNPYY